MDVGAGFLRRVRRVVGHRRKLSDWKRFTYKENSRGTFARSGDGREKQQVNRGKQRNLMAKRTRPALGGNYGLG
jgi:hypothetical protein